MIPAGICSSRRQPPSGLKRPARNLAEQARAYVVANFSAEAYANRIETIYAEMQAERGGL